MSEFGACAPSSRTIIIIKCKKLVLAALGESDSYRVVVIFLAAPHIADSIRRTTQVTAMKRTERETAKSRTTKHQFLQPIKTDSRTVIFTQIYRVHIYI